ncbi:hypothetical protein [Nonomuraea sp. NPDC049709]|uniref:hypothetical protein n=1 Tax=Nonomuraea sp. NPDC049709 TaxID=3154736 RepID=UPI00343CCA64
MESAITVKPMADLTFQGGLTESSFVATARGRARFQPDRGYSPGDCDFALNVDPADMESFDLVILSPDDRYVNGKVVGDSTDVDIRDYLDMITVMSGIGVILDLVAGTTGVSRAGRRYAGGLVAPKAPISIKERLVDMAGWKASRLAGTRLNWRLELDRDNRPRSFMLSWLVSMAGTEIASSYETTFANWREGRIPAPR